MRYAFWAALSIVTAALFIGCSVNLEQAVVGRYRAVVDVSAVPESQMLAAQQASAMLNGVGMEFKKDKTVHFSMAGQEISGTWKIENGEIVVTVPKGAKFPKLVPEDGAKRLVPIFSDEETKKMAGARIWLKRE